MNMGKNVTKAGVI